MSINSELLKRIPSLNNKYPIATKVLAEIDLIWKNPKSNSIIKMELIKITATLFVEEQRGYHKTNLRLIRKKLEQYLEEMFSLYEENLTRMHALVPSYEDLVLKQDKMNFNPNNLVQTAYYLGLKGVSHPEVARYRHRGYGLNPVPYYAMKAQNSMQYLQEIKRSNSFNLNHSYLKDRLVQLCKHRNNYFNYSRIINDFDSNYSGKTQEAVKMVQDNIELLSEPDSDKTVQLLDGSTAFSIPGGNNQHAINYEFRKQGDDYYFIIHNRMPGSLQSDLHGLVSFSNDSDKTYCKTRVPIKLSKEVLRNASFIQALITSTTKSDYIYSYINKALIKTGLGEIVKSETELLLETLHEQYHSPFVPASNKTEIRHAALELIKSDKNFHSRQLYASCVESCITVFEKEIAPVSVIKGLKKFTLNHLSTTIKDTPDELERTKETPVLKHIAEKIDKLASTSETATPVDLKVICGLISRNKIRIEANEARHKTGTEYALSDNTIYLPAKFSDSQDNVLKVVKKNGMVLANASERLRNNEEIALSAVENNGLALQFVSETLKNNKALVLAALENNAFAYDFASEELKRDRDIIIAALKTNIFAFSFLADELQNNEVLLLSLISNPDIDSSILEIFPERFRQKKEFIIQAVAKKPDRYSFLSDGLKQNKAFLLPVLKETPSLFKKIPDSLRYNEEFIFQAVQENWEILLSLPDNIKVSLKIGLKTLPIVLNMKFGSVGFDVAPGPVISLCKTIYECLGLKFDFTKVNKTTALEIIKYSSGVLNELSADLKNDKEVVLVAVRQNGLALQYASERLRNDSDVITAALKQDSRAREFIFDSLKSPEERKSEPEAALSVADSFKDKLSLTPDDGWGDEEQEADEGHKQGVDEEKEWELYDEHKQGVDEEKEWELYDEHKQGVDEEQKQGVDEGHKQGVDEEQKQGVDEEHKQGVDEEQVWELDGEQEIDRSEVLVAASPVKTVYTPIPSFQLKCLSAISATSITLATGVIALSLAPPIVGTTLLAAGTIAGLRAFSLWSKNKPETPDLDNSEHPRINLP